MSVPKPSNYGPYDDRMRRISEEFRTQLFPRGIDATKAEAARRGMMMSAEYQSHQQSTRFDEADSQALEFVFGHRVRRELDRIAADPRSIFKG